MSFEAERQLMSQAIPQESEPLRRLPSHRASARHLKVRTAISQRSLKPVPVGAHTWGTRFGNLRSPDQG